MSYSTPDAQPGDATPAGSDGFDAVSLLFSMEAAADPHPAYREVRERCPVGRTPSLMGEGFSAYVSRYDDVLWTLKHPELFSSGAEAVSIGQEEPLIPLQVDPPEHAKWRRFLDPEFSPKRVRELEPDMRALVNTVVDTFASRGECDFHEDFATPLPSTMFLRLMGLPMSDLDQFLAWRDQTIRPTPTADDPTGQVSREAAGAAITRYFEQAIRAKQEQPGDDLMTRIANGEIEGRPLTLSEQLGISHLMLVAGLDTVTATLDCMVAYLAQHPDRRAHLLDHPDAIDGVIEELLRHQTPVQMVVRIAAQDCEVGGVTIRKGDGITVLLGASNTDDRQFDDADSVDFGRGDNRHLAFGAGPHRCLGSHLARMELRVALEEFHRRIRDYEIVDGTELLYSPGIRQTMALPLRFTAEA